MGYLLGGLLLIGLVVAVVKILSQRAMISRLREYANHTESTMNTGLAIRQKQVDQQHHMLEAAIERENTLNNRLYHLEQEYDQKLQIWKHQEEKRIREDAVTKSRQVQKGFASEHMAPFQTKYNPRDFRHIGDPIDFVVFAGSTEIKDGSSDEIEEVVILDIKTGKSDLNKTQRRIRDAVIAGKVSFATYNPDTDSLRTWTKTGGEEE
jgi:predicted Holliday junction resolvase-like endonuclease